MRSNVDPHRVGNLPRVLDNIKLARERGLNACIFDVLTKFQSVSSLNFKLEKEHDTAVKSMLMIRNVLAVLPTGYGKSTYVMASEHRNNTFRALQRRPGLLLVLGRGFFGVFPYLSLWRSALGRKNMWEDSA